MKKKGAIGAALVLVGVMIVVIIVLVVVGPSLIKQFRGLDGYLRGIETTNKFCDQIAKEVTLKDVSLRDGDQKYTGQTVPKPGACEVLAREKGEFRKGRDGKGQQEFRWTFSKESNPEYGNEFCCLFIVNVGENGEDLPPTRTGTSGSNTGSDDATGASDGVIITTNAAGDTIKTYPDGTVETIYKTPIDLIDLNDLPQEAEVPAQCKNYNKDVNEINIDCGGPCAVCECVFETNRFVYYEQPDSIFYFAFFDLSWKFTQSGDGTPSDVGNLALGTYSNELKELGRELRTKNETEGRQYLENTFCIFKTITKTS
ncbi:hypothetical protein HN592_05300 [Candidatus Woesearchaeota archaeon]|jgi:hypothetical protein|nr:hypothetical protein [Candidatus Woesearchaeota archaeon]MBT4367802.1 hypothetical protein [Candidatus Woesearchaeota archaeon]MBT4712290.1 hypothetical protein [Candidatus Woesearchaeota archaeon]MBT6638838.1 hypothetical protein [Candidatus Woesearchaeota archaeon]MBT7134482.1 hypothetical protein [Candidatus Woesearchaeota archaeon]